MNSTQSGSNHIETIGDITLDTRYWDCECHTTDKKWAFIHPKSEERCDKCGATADEQPDARAEEVEMMLVEQRDARAVEPENFFDQPEPVTTVKHRCDNCEVIWVTDADHNEILDYEGELSEAWGRYAGLAFTSIDDNMEFRERLTAGETCPSGECPECESLTFLVDPPRYTAEARLMVAEKALKALIDTVEASGGVVANERGGFEPVANRDWPDLGDAYVEACKALGREPQCVDALPSSYSYRCNECQQEAESNTEPPPNAVCAKCAAEFDSQQALIQRIEARGNWRNVTISTSKDGNPVIRFKSNINLENSFSSRSVGRRQSEMELHRNGIEWIVDGVDELGAEIGLEFGGEKKITGYDGVFEIPEEVCDWLEFLGYDCSEVRDDEEDPTAEWERGYQRDVAASLRRS